MMIIHSNGKHLHGASAGSRTKTVVAANVDPSSLFPGFVPLIADAVITSPGQTSSAHIPTHCATSHCKWTSEPIKCIHNYHYYYYYSHSQTDHMNPCNFTFWKFKHGSKNSGSLSTVRIYFKSWNNLWINWASEIQSYKKMIKTS